MVLSVPLISLTQKEIPKDDPDLAVPGFNREQQCWYQWDGMCLEAGGLCVCLGEGATAQAPGAARLVCADTYTMAVRIRGRSSPKV